MRKLQKNVVYSKLYEQGIAHLLLIIIVVVVSMCGLLLYSWQKGLIKTTTLQQTPTFTPTTNETANWKLFIDDDYNYSFKYPSDWEVKTVIKDDNNYILSLKSTYIAPPNSDPFWGINVIVDTNPREEDVSMTWFMNNLLKNYPEDTRIDDFGFEETTFLNQKALRDRYGNLIISKGKYMYKISWAVHLTEEEKVVKPIYNQILSTFEFLD